MFQLQLKHLFFRKKDHLCKDKLIHMFCLEIICNTQMNIETLQYIEEKCNLVNVVW